MYMWCMHTWTHGHVTDVDCYLHTHTHTHTHKGCFAGEYFSYNSSMCLSCPANSNSTEQGVTECLCFDGYYRAMGEEDLPCTCEY